MREAARLFFRIDKACETRRHDADGIGWIGRHDADGIGQRGIGRHDADGIGWIGRHDADGIGQLGGLPRF